MHLNVIAHVAGVTDSVSLKFNHIYSSVSPLGQALQSKRLFPGASLKWTKLPAGHLLQLPLTKAKLSE